jgi:hypothetical protein
MHYNPSFSLAYCRTPNSTLHVVGLRETESLLALHFCSDSWHLSITQFRQPHSQRGTES